MKFFRLAYNQRLGIQKVKQYTQFLTIDHGEKWLISQPNHVVINLRLSVSIMTLSHKSMPNLLVQVQTLPIFY